MKYWKRLVSYKLFLLFGILVVNGSFIANREEFI